MAPNVFSRVSSASAFELQIKRQILEKMLGLEEHIQGQKCEKDKLLLMDKKWNIDAGLKQYVLQREKGQKKILWDSGRLQERLQFIYV